MNKHSPFNNWRVQIASAREAADFARAHSQFIDAEIARSPRSAASLYRSSVEWLAAVNARIYLVRAAEGTPLATCNSHADDRVVEIGGLVKAHRAAPGEAARLAVAIALVDAAGNGSAAFQADSRVFPEGQFSTSDGKPLAENVGSLAIFDLFGFSRDEIIAIPILGNDRDRHLLASGEQAGDVLHFRTRMLRSTPATLGKAHAFIRSLKVGG